MSEYWCVVTKDIMAPNFRIFPIQVGKAVSKENLKYKGDDAGDKHKLKKLSYLNLQECIGRGKI